MKLTYDEVVSICDAHGICLPVDCVEMVVSIIEHINPDHSGDGGDAVPSNCDVRKILLHVVPGDGDGHEVYAKNATEVEDLLSSLGERLEDFESAQVAPVPQDGSVES